MPSEKELEDLKHRYAALTDYDVSEMHCVGRAGLVSDEAWELLKAEYERRQLAGSAIEEEVMADHVQEELVDELQAIQAPLLARVVQGGMDMLVAGGIAFFPALIASE